VLYPALSHPDLERDAHGNIGRALEQTLEPLAEFAIRTSTNTLVRGRYTQDASAGFGTGRSVLLRFFFRLLFSLGWVVQRRMIVLFRKVLRLGLKGVAYKVKVRGKVRKVFPLLGRVSNVARTPEVPHLGTETEPVQNLAAAGGLPAQLPSLRSVVLTNQSLESGIVR